jgi:hypothetical protein
VGKSLETGVGVDRRAGQYRISGNVIFTNRFLPIENADEQDVTVVGSIDRSFARETRSLRILGVYNPGDRSAFARAIGTWSVRDNVTLEGSTGLFTGDSIDLLSQFDERDFLYARLKVFF